MEISKLFHQFSWNFHPKFHHFTVKKFTAALKRPRSGPNGDFRDFSRLLPLRLQFCFFLDETSERAEKKWKATNPVMDPADYLTNWPQSLRYIPPPLAAFQPIESGPQRIITETYTIKFGFIQFFSFKKQKFAYFHYTRNFVSRSIQKKKTSTWLGALWAYFVSATPSSGDFRNW